MASFSLRVVNPRVPAGAVQPNIAWTSPPYASNPFVMPTDREVWYTNTEPSGRFVLWYQSGGQNVSGQTSPLVEATDGAAYIWDMAANTVTKVGEKSDTPDTPAKPPSLLDNPLVKYGLYGVGGYVALKFLRIIR